MWFNIKLRSDLMRRQVKGVMIDSVAYDYEEAALAASNMAKDIEYLISDENFDEKGLAIRSLNLNICSIMFDSTLMYNTSKYTKPVSSLVHEGNYIKYDMTTGRVPISKDVMNLAVSKKFPVLGDIQVYEIMHLPFTFDFTNKDELKLIDPRHYEILIAVLKLYAQLNTIKTGVEEADSSETLTIKSNIPIKPKNDIGGIIGINYSDKIKI